MIQNANKQIIGQFRKGQEQAEDEHGYSYSGYINMLDGDIQWKDLKLDSRNDADDWFESNARNKGDTYAVSFREDTTGRLSEQNKVTLDSWSQGYLKKSGLAKLAAEVGAGVIDGPRQRRSPRI